MIPPSFLPRRLLIVPTRLRLGRWLSGVLLVLPLVSALALDYQVSPSATPGGNGSEASPFSSIIEARDAVRKVIAAGLREGITIHLAKGDYFVGEPILFDDRDGGGGTGHTVTYQGAPDLGSRIYGGRRITGWESEGNERYSAMVPDAQKHLTLYENGQAANGGFFHTYPADSEGNWHPKGTGALDYIPRHLPMEKQTVVLGTAADVFVVKGRSMEQPVSDLCFDGLSVIGSDHPAGMPGEIGIHHSRWSGQYDGKEWHGENLGVPGPDLMHGQFFLENARRVVIRNSRLYGAGVMAVVLYHWAQENRVENCWIEDAGDNGIFLMGWEPGRGPFQTVASSYVNKKNVIRNNVFQDIGRFASDAGGVYLYFSGDNLVEHNLFHGISRYGVSAKGWRTMVINSMSRFGDERRGVPTVSFYDGYVVTPENLGSELNHSRNNLIRQNDLSQIARMGSDLGAIEMWGAGTGNRWEENAIHDIVPGDGWDQHLHALFVDDGCHGALLKGNIIYWLAGGDYTFPIYSKGNDQRTLFNIVADCEMKAYCWAAPYVEPARDMVLSNNIISGLFEECCHENHGVKSSGGNLYWLGSPEEGPVRDSLRKSIEGQLAAFAKEGHLEAGSAFADPMFDRQHPWWDTRCTDFRLKPDSPALRMGFQQTDPSRIGLQEGFPFDLHAVFAHPAHALWKAANYDRIYLDKITGGIVTARRNKAPLARDSWVRYQGVDFGDGFWKQFRAGLGYLPPQKTFQGESGGMQVMAMPLNESAAIPYWEVSPVYNEEGKKGPELFDLPFTPEQDPSSVAWKSMIAPVISRVSVEHPLGVVNCDVMNGEGHANGACYLRASLFSPIEKPVRAKVAGASGLKVWLNGEQVFSQPGPLVSGKDLKLALKKGWNRFLVKVVQDAEPWAPAYHGYGNFWASLRFNHAEVGGTWTLPGLPGKEVSIQPDQGRAVELRLDAPDGKLIGEVPYGRDSCPVEAVRGLHDLFLVFPNQNVQSVDWYRFE